jgi:CheY-like chemotaxis protein
MKWKPSGKNGITMKKILVIEDCLEIRENVAELLLLNGYEVLTASNGKEGMETTLVEQPDLLICDISMPGMDGFDVLTLLRKNKRIAHIPLIFLTARAEKKDVLSGLNQGAQHYIVKPFTEEQLIRAVSSACNIG